MFKEIAVDPAAVAASYLQFNHIIDRFGIPEGRLIAAFPSKWKRLVYQAAHAQLQGKLDLKRIEERLHKLPPTVLLSRERPGQGCAENWIGAAIDEHRRLPFDAVVAAAEVGESDFLQPADISVEHPSFAPNRQWKVKRDAVSMANCCGPLWSSSDHIKLVDRNFDAAHRRFKRPFVEFMRRVKPGTTVDVFRGDEIGNEHYVTGVQRALTESLPEGIVLRLFMRSHAEMHRRFVLSRIGGVSFDIGLDDDANGDRPEDSVTILQENLFEEAWSTYAGEDFLIRLTT